MAKLPVEVKILGRTSKEAPDVLFWTGSRYEMNVKASYLTVHIEAAYGGQELGEQGASVPDASVARGK